MSWIISHAISAVKSETPQHPARHEPHTTASTHPGQSQPTTTPDQQPTNAPHTSRPASPNDPGGFGTVLLAASTTTGFGNLRPPASRVALRPVSLFCSTGFGGFPIYSIPHENAYSTT